MAKLSILIPARNEEWLQRTIEDIFEHIEGDTEVIVGIDGLPYQGRLTDKWHDKNIHFELAMDPVGQRAMTNRLAKRSTAKYLMKTDAHVSFSQGFDVEMMKQMEDDMVLVPSLMNLHVFNWVCDDCQAIHEQGNPPAECWRCKKDKFHKDLVWQVRPRPIETDFAFDSRLIFGYTNITKPGDLTESMSIQGSGFMVTRERYWENDLCSEDFHSWGQQGVEVACKTWLSGGRVMCTKNAYMGHFFRTPTGFPYPIIGEEIFENQRRSRELFLGNNWPKQTRSFQSLIEQFNYPLDWTPEKVAELCAHFEKMV